MNNGSLRKEPLVPMISGIHRTSHMETSDEDKMGQGIRFPLRGVLLDAA
jgi:hypothetical protein